MSRAPEEAGKIENTGWMKKNQIPNRRYRGQRIVAEQNFFGIKDTYYIVENPQLKNLISWTIRLYTSEDYIHCIIFFVH